MVASLQPKRTAGISEQQSPGGFHVLWPRPLAPEEWPATWWCLSDLHLGSSHTDYGLLQQDLDRCKREGGRVLINGDVFDLILPGDHKRFRQDALHFRLWGCTDLHNKVLDWAVELLEPLAPQIDMIGCGNHECHDSATEVLTDSGWKLFKDVLDGDQLATFNKITGHIEYQIPVMVEYHYDGPMKHVKTHNMDFCVTPNHRILNKSKADRGENKDSWIVDEYQHIPRRTRSLRVPVAGNSLNEEYPLSDDQLRFVGWVLTDGCLGKHKNEVTVYQRASKSSMITEILDRLGASYSVYKTQRKQTEICGRVLVKEPEESHTIRIKSGAFRDWVWAVIPPDKSLPWWVKNLSDRQFEVFLNALIDGDGSRRPDDCPSLVLYGKKPFLDSIQVACLEHGYRSSVSEYSNHSGDHHRLNITKGTLRSVRQFRNHERTVWYRGMVYCATVWNDTLVTRRNGKVLISGNSASEKIHSLDLILMLCDRLNSSLRARGSTHTVLYGGYSGFLVYRDQLAWYYHHGWGGGSDLKAASGDLDRILASVEGVDVAWLGHRHTRMSAHVARISPPRSGFRPVTREVRFVRTGSYLRAHWGSEGAKVKAKGRGASYAVDAGLVPTGLGGAKITLETPGGTLRIEQ